MFQESSGVSSEVPMAVLVLLCPVATELLNSSSGNIVFMAKHIY